MGAGGSAHKSDAANTTARGLNAPKAASEHNHNSNSNNNSNSSAAATKRGDTLRVIVRHLQPGEALSYDVGRVTEGSVPTMAGAASAASAGAARTDTGLPPPPSDAKCHGTLFGWFVEDLDRPGTWEPYTKESADRLEDAFMHMRDMCTVVMKKRTYTVNLNTMQQQNPVAASGHHHPASTSATNRARDVKRVPVIKVTDPATGEMKVQEAPPTMVDPFAETESVANDANSGNAAGGAEGHGIAQGAGDTVGTATSTPVYDGNAAALGGLPHLIRTVVPHNSPIYTMECSPNLEQLCSEARSVAEPAGGALILSSGKDLQLLEWSLDTARVVTRYELPETTNKNSVLTATYSPTGKWMIAGLDDRTARLYAIGNPNEIHRLQGHTHKVYGAGILAGDTHAVTASMDCRVKVWDISTGTCARNLVPHGSHIFALRPHPTDPNFALTGGEDRAVCMHDFRQENSVVAIFTGHERTIWDLAWNPADGTFGSCGMDATVRIYDPRTSTQGVQTLRNHTAAVHSLVYTPRGRGLLSCSKDFTVKLTRTDDWRVRWQAKAHASTVFRVRYHAGKELMLTAASDSSVNVWKWSAVNQL